MVYCVQWLRTTCIIHQSNVQSFKAAVSYHGGTEQPTCEVYLEIEQLDHMFVLDALEQLNFAKKVVLCGLVQLAFGNTFDGDCLVVARLSSAEEEEKCCLQILRPLGLLQSIYNSGVTLCGSILPFFWPCRPSRKFQSRDCPRRRSRSIWVPASYSVLPSRLIVHVMPAFCTY